MEGWRIRQNRRGGVAAAMTGVTAAWAGLVIASYRRWRFAAKQQAAPLVGGGRLVVVAWRHLDYASSGWVSATGGCHQFRMVDDPFPVGWDCSRPWTGY